jgi:hypothetical protein
MCKYQLTSANEMVWHGLVIRPAIDLNFPVVRSANLIRSVQALPRLARRSPGVFTYQ